VHRALELTLVPELGDAKPLSADLCIDAQDQVAGTFRLVFARGVLSGTVDGALVSALRIDQAHLPAEEVVPRRN